MIEVDVLEGIEAALAGKKVYAVDVDGTASTVNMTKFVEIIKGLRFLIDRPIGNKPEPKPEPKLPETPEQETAAPMETMETPEAPKERKKQRGRKTDSVAEQAILKAWHGGDRKIGEIMEITGYSYNTVRKYIPITPMG